MGYVYFTTSTEKLRFLFLQPAMLKNRTIISSDQQIYRGDVPSGRSTSCRALGAEPVRQNENGTYDIEANTESHLVQH